MDSGSSHWRWHLDEMIVKINDERHDPWRTADHEGEVLKSFVKKTRDMKAGMGRPKLCRIRRMCEVPRAARRISLQVRQKCQSSDAVQKDLIYSWVTSQPTDAARHLSTALAFEEYTEMRVLDLHCL